MHIYSRPAVCHSIYIVPSDEESVFKEIILNYLSLHSSNVMLFGRLGSYSQKC